MPLPISLLPLGTRPGDGLHVPGGRYAFTSAEGTGVTLTVAGAGLACCAVEVGAAVAAHPQRLQALGADDPGDGLSVLVVAGTVTDALAPVVLALWESLPVPRAALAFGACATCGGPYWDSYSVTKGTDQLLPVDVVVPGCPPSPAALLDGLELLVRNRASR